MTTNLTKAETKPSVEHYLKLKNKHPLDGMDLV